MIEKTKIYTIIVTYNGEKWIRKCLISVSKSSIETEIILVDNNSKDDTLNIIENEFPEVILLKQTENMGFGKANNIGITYALNKAAKYFFLINQDVYIFPDTIEKLVLNHTTNNEFGVLSPMHLNGERNCLDKNFSEYIKHNPNIYFDAITLKLKTIYAVPFVNAAAWLISKNTLDTIGGFDPMFFHYGEDDNYCHRLKFHKIELGVVSDAFICHDRELRERLKSLTTKQTLLNKEKSFKLKWADINKELNDDIYITLKKIKVRILKSVLKLRLVTAKNLIQEFKLIKRIEPEILKSRKINSTKGRHYL